MTRFCWQEIISEKRIPEYEQKEDAKRYRSEIESDYHRIIRSASYRRLQDKTQVFPLDHSDFVRTRLTHSMEVSSLAKMIGKQVCAGIYEQGLEEKENLPDPVNMMETLNCAGLLHDIGNPPFGHFGEFSIRDWFKKNLDRKMFRDRTLRSCLDAQQIADLENFEGNAQALRIITKLHRLIGNHGMHLTSAVMDTIIKYPYDSLTMLEEKKKPKAERSLLKKKIGYFQSETEQFLKIKENTKTSNARNPLCFILEAADDLAYTFADLEDGYNKGLYSYLDLYQVLKDAKDEAGIDMLEREYERFEEDHLYTDAYVEGKQSAVFSWLTKKQLSCVSVISDAFLEHYEAIMNGTFQEELITVSKAGVIINALKTFAYKRIYCHSSILKLELMGNEILCFLLDRFVDALIYYDTEVELSEIQTKYIDLLSRNYLEQYHEATKNMQDEDAKLYHRLLLATDFLSGMTDSFAKRLYQDIRGF